VQVVVDCIEQGERGVEGALVVVVFVAGAVARVDDFVVLRVVDVQFGRADADDGACMTLVQVFVLRDSWHVKQTRINAKSDVSNSTGWIQKQRGSGLTVFVMKATNLKGHLSAADSIPVELVQMGQRSQFGSRETGNGRQIEPIEDYPEQIDCPESSSRSHWMRKQETQQFHVDT
jgi:hypothetical protein